MLLQTFDYLSLQCCLGVASDGCAPVPLGSQPGRLRVRRRSPWEIEHGGGHFGVAEHLRPIGEGEVCVDEQNVFSQSLLIRWNSNCPPGWLNGR